MIISLPDVLAAKLTPDDAALNLAVGLFTAEKLTMGQAAEVAGVSQNEFMRELGRRKISLHYGLEEFADDLETIRHLRSSGS